MMTARRLVMATVAVFSGMQLFAAEQKPNILFLMAEDIGNDQPFFHQVQLKVTHRQGNNSRWQNRICAEIRCIR